MDTAAITVITVDTIKVDTTKQRPSSGFPGSPSEEWARFKDDSRRFPLYTFFIVNIDTSK